VTFIILHANALHIPLADASVQCVVTSPPYWNLRDYGIAGQLGLEPTIEEYVANMVAVFREVWRVLRTDGTVWLNLGDSFASTPSGAIASSGLQGGQSGQRAFRQATVHKNVPVGLKPKDLCGIPWRVAFALQADGWYLRSDIVWHKPNPMPESVTDRPTKAHEYLFLLTKSARYYYDAEAIREPVSVNWVRGAGAPMPEMGAHRPTDGARGHQVKRVYDEPKGANRRSVWTIPTQPCPLAHFATMPPALVEPCIKAGTSERGCCPKCGAPWERVVERVSFYDHVTTAAGKSKDGPYAGQTGNGEGTHDVRHGAMAASSTLGWRPTCDCNAEPVPCVVLDPFSGAGTVPMVADRLGRHGVGTELNREYCEMADGRCYQDAPLLAWAQEAV
jgi:DNA modification methylase